MQEREFVNLLSDDELRRQLRALPLDEPDNGFEIRLLRRALQQRGPEFRAEISGLKIVGDSLVRLGLVALIFLTMSTVFVLLPGIKSPVANYTAQEPVPSRLSEVRSVHFVLHSKQQMLGAIIRIVLPDNVSFDGYEHRRVLQWETDIFAGRNRLSLPVKISNEKAAGEILVEVKYRGSSKLLRQNLTKL
ncbi:hypothetical protein ACJJIG_06945 [Microbulbifer sp. SSSA007]|uniref:hypothetical protein n=1 Tax=Microbulbifer sp. SSSA007 TaxID=3243379 RepID=UPI0040393B40